MHQLTSTPVSAAQLRSLFLNGKTAKSHGWLDGYESVFVNATGGGQMISNAVLRYASSGGAHTDLKTAVAALPKLMAKAARGAYHVTPINGVGDEAIALQLVSQPRITGIYFRQGKYMGSISMIGSASLSTAQKLARIVDARVKALG